MNFAVKTMNHKSLLILLSIGILVTIAFGFNYHKQSAKGSVHSNSDLIDSQSNPVDLSGFKGKVVFINNWASWCPPCIAEMPSIQELKNKLKVEDIVFVMVSFDENHDKAMAFMKKKGYDFDIYYPGNKYPYSTESIPTTFVLDKSGKVVIERTGITNYVSDNMIKEIRSILAKP